ncbi:MAG: phage tail protein [Selenomonadaceae bacterium]|nr:phage tail protein [Selenomonadaceae bacterium]
MATDLQTLIDGLNLNQSQINQLQTNLNTLQSSKLLELDEDVAKAKEGLRTTANGFNLLAKAVAGKQLTYTKVVLGDSIRNGNIVQPTDEEIYNMTALIHASSLVVPIADVSFNGNGTATVKCVVQNQNLSQGFWCRELGLFAKTSDSSTEYLVSYKNFGPLAKYIIAGNGAISETYTVNLITVVDAATNVTAVVDASLVAVNQSEFSAHINSTNPHPNIPHKSTEVTSSSQLWATGADNQLHTISATNLGKQILGDDLTTLPHLSARVTQNELNIANLFSQAGAKDGGNLDANLLLAEDFTDCRFCDLFSVKVDDEVAGISNVRVADAKGILEGHYYTISDGVRSQYVQVQSVAKSEQSYTIVFTANLRYSFNLRKTYLYRSTGLIMDSKLGGSGDVRSSTFQFTDVWKGESSSAEQTLTFDTTIKNKTKFDLSGDFGFTPDGEFTIA